MLWSHSGRRNRMLCSYPRTFARGREDSFSMTRAKDLRLSLIEMWRGDNNNTVKSEDLVLWPSFGKGKIEREKNK